MKTAFVHDYGLGGIHKCSSLSTAFLFAVGVLGFGSGWFGFGSFRSRQGSSQKQLYVLRLERGNERDMILQVICTWVVL